MGRYWKYVLLAGLVLILGTVVMAAAPNIESFVITDKDGERAANLAEATGQGSVSNLPPVRGSLPNPGDIVNLFPTITEGTPGDCTEGLDYQVANDKALLITDILFPDADSAGTINLTFWTDDRETILILRGFPRPSPQVTSFVTPLLINAGERLCLSSDSASGGSGAEVPLFISGALVSAQAR